MDPRFPSLVRAFRERRGLSLRRLAAIVHYSHTYLWEIEAGRKQPNIGIARTLDKALSADGQLTQMVTEDTTTISTHLEAAMQLLDANRHQVQDLAARARSVKADPEHRPTGSQWARLAVWLYDAIVRSRPPLRRREAHQSWWDWRPETETFTVQAEVMAQRRTARVECISTTECPAPADIAQQLMIGLHDAVIRRESRYFADDEAIQLGTSFIPLHPPDVSHRPLSSAPAKGSQCAPLEGVERAAHRIREVVCVRLSTPAEAKSLAITSPALVFEIIHTCFDDQHRPFEATRFTIRTDRIVLDFELPVED